MVLLLVVSMLLLALTAEGAIRLRQWLRVGTSGDLHEMYRRDEASNLRMMVPGFRTSTISINSLGFRGPEIAQPKPPRTVRIAFLGASTTFCGEASGDHTVWPQLVIDGLRHRFQDVNFDLVNGGVPGYVMQSSRDNLRLKVAPLQPDVIVIYEATNDLTGEIHTLAKAAGLVTTDLVGPRQPSWLERHSLLWSLAAKNLSVIAAQRSATVPSPAGKLTIQPEQLGGEFERQLRALLRESAATGARVAVATFATHLRRGQTPEQQQRAVVSSLLYMPAMTAEGLLAAFARYNQIIREVATAEGALLIGGEETIPGDPIHFADSVHFTDRGSQRMAERVLTPLAADSRLLDVIGRQGAR